MFQMRTVLLVAVTCFGSWLVPATAQMQPSTVLEVDVENYVLYLGDVNDFAKYGTQPALTPATSKYFLAGLCIADVVAVNGKPAKGTLLIRVLTVTTRPIASGGQAIADTTRNHVADESVEILQPDGTPVGTIIAVGLSGGVPPPGAPTGQGQGNNAIAGGSGAFLGVRGQFGSRVDPAFPVRLASATENPAERRTLGGGKARFYLHIIPMVRPEVAVTSSGPAVFHRSDFSPVTSANPAQAGEVLVALANNLGPTVPNPGPGQPFPAVEPYAAVNSPVEVAVGGKPTQVFNCLGWPGSVDTYRIDFRVPEGIPPGLATIQLTAAWIPGPEVKIPIR